MKIAFISLMEGNAWGGSEELWYRTALLALAKKMKVFANVNIFAGDSEKLQSLSEKGGLVSVRPRFTRKSFLKRVIEFVGINSGSKKDHPTIRELKAFDPDVICISQGGTYDLNRYDFLSSYLLESKKPFFIVVQFNFEHGSLPSVVRKKMIKIFNQAGNIFFVSKRNWAVAERQLVSKIKNGCHIDNPYNLIKPGIIPFNFTDILSFACVARLECDFKGQDLLLEALSAPEWKERKWQLNFYGAGRDEEYLNNLISFYNLTDRVYLFGHVNNIEEIWEKNHLLVLASIAEGTPLALIEAMLCGRSAVVTDVGDNARLIQEGESGFVAEAPVVKAISRALNRAWESKSNLGTLGLNAHKNILEIRSNVSPEEELFSVLSSREIEEIKGSSIA